MFRKPEDHLSSGEFPALIFSEIIGGCIGVRKGGGRALGILPPSGGCQEEIPSAAKKQQTVACGDGYQGLCYR